MIELIFVCHVDLVQASRERLKSKKMTPAMVTCRNFVPTNLLHPHTLNTLSTVSLGQGGQNPPSSSPSSRALRLLRITRRSWRSVMRYRSPLGVHRHSFPHSSYQILSVTRGEKKMFGGDQGATTTSTPMPSLRTSYLSSKT